MSCEQSRHKFFQIMADSGAMDAEALEKVYQQNRHTPATTAERLAASAKTRMLFQLISNYGLKPPAHAADGMPRAESQPGYAAVYDLLKKQGLLGDSVRLKKAKSVRAIYEPGDPTLGLDGRDAEGYDRWGYNQEGLDRNGYDRDGFNKDGYDRDGRNRHGFHYYHHTDAKGFCADGYKNGLDANGFDKYGYKDGCDPDGYDQNGYDKDGFDREGYNAHGVDRNGDPDPNFLPDANGFYPDGFDAEGFDADGYDQTGFDRFGFGRDGYNALGWDRNGFDRKGQQNPRITDPEGYDYMGRKRGIDRVGYNIHALKNGRTFTGYDVNMLDADGKPRKVRNDKGKWVTPKYTAEGFDADGYDQRGYHRDTGLTAPDEKGRRYNTFGWIYDEDSAPAIRKEKLDEEYRAGKLDESDYVKALAALESENGECYDPDDPTRRVKVGVTLYRYLRRSRRLWATSSPYIPPAPPAPLEPRAFISEDKYHTLNSGYLFEDRHLHLTYDERTRSIPTVGWRRGSLDGKVKGGILLRCPHCGQFTNGFAHTCPNFPGEGPVIVARNGMVMNLPHQVLVNPRDPNYDPEFDILGGYNKLGFDREEYNKRGYDRRGYDREGYDQAGYDIFGYDRDGYDRSGYNNMGTNRRGEKRGSSLKDVRELIRGEGTDLLNNNDLARMYGQIATGLIGKPRQVILKEGGGFSTDMRGRIYADPYPLGRGADPRHNLVVTRAGIYHELGHEQFTPQHIWGRVLEVVDGKQQESGLGEAGRKLLPRFYNIVEDGRMERDVARAYKGAAEILAASCRLEPRWDEEVGKGVSDSDQVFWALLYTGLPYYRVRPAVREGMTPRARKVFEELEPIMTRAVRGTPEDAYQAAVHIARRFEEEGFIVLPPKDSSKPMPRPPQGSRGQPQQSDGQQGGQGGQSQQPDGQQGGQGGQSQQPDDAQGGSMSGSSGQEQSSSAGSPDGKKQEENPQGAGRGSSGGAQPEEKKGRRKKKAEDTSDKRGKKPEGEEEGASDKQGKKSEEEGSSSRESSSESGQSSETDSSGGGGSGASSSGTQSGSQGKGNESEEFLFGNEVVDAAMRSVERDAASALENGIRSRSRPNAIGKPLHNPLPDEASVSQRYRDASGLPQSVTVSLPKGVHSDGLQGRRTRHKEVASMMARPLKAIREQAEIRLRRLNQGRLDRRQLVNAYKGLDDVYAETRKKPETSFSASVMVDLSGSMREHVQSLELYDSVMTLGDCFDMMDMPYEVRAFGSSNAQVKSLGERFDPDRAAYLAFGDLGGTHLHETAGLAHSALLAADENNKMMICLSDGSLDDHGKTARILNEARRNGVVTFGVFLGEGADSKKMDELYGRGSWTSIHALSDMPKLVAQRLASIFKSMR